MLLLRLQASLIKLCDETHTLTPGPSNMRKMFILCSLLCTRRETERYCLLIWGSYDVVWLLRRICRRDRSLNRGHDDPVKDTEEVRMVREKEKTRGSLKTPETPLEEAPNKPINRLYWFGVLGTSLYHEHHLLHMTGGLMRR